MGNNRYKILVVEDEANIRSFVSAVLETNGYQVLTAGTCSQGEPVAASHCPDLIILDLGLPDQDGLELIRRVRLSSLVPVIVLSARSGEKDKVAALDAGANDYVTKPFGTEELMARVRAAIRNSRHGPEKEGRFVTGDMEIDYDKRRISIGGEEIRLTQTEYNIVAFLSEHPGKVLTYAAIIKAVWGDAGQGCVKRLQVNMANIRKKFGVKPGRGRYILNELGVGYRMQEEHE